MNTPPPSSPPRRTGFPVAARLTIFTVRHLIGLGAFAWITKTARETDPQSSLWLIVAGLFLAYLAAAVFGGWQLFAALQRQRRQRRQRGRRG